MKRKQQVMAALAVVCLAGAAACNRTPPGGTETSASNAPDQSSSQTASASLDDATLTTKVKAALMAKSDLNSTSISVTTNNGEVTLQGKVPPQQIAMAEQVARGVGGVKDVVNDLQPESASSG